MSLDLSLTHLWVSHSKGRYVSAASGAVGSTLKNSDTNKSAHSFKTREEWIRTVCFDHLSWSSDLHYTQRFAALSGGLPQSLFAEAGTATVEKFKVNDIVLFRFPNDYKDELGIVTDIRIDDETNEQKYDVCMTKPYHDQRVRDFNYEPVKWVEQYRIKKPILDSEAAFMLALDIELTSNLRRTKAAEERKKKKEKQNRMNEQLAKIKERLLALQSEEAKEGERAIANANEITANKDKKDEKEDK